MPDVIDPESNCDNCGESLNLTRRVWLRPDGGMWCINCARAEAQRRQAGNPPS